MNIVDVFERLDEKLAEIIGYENIEQHSSSEQKECCSYYQWVTTPLFVDDDLC